MPPSNSPADAFSRRRCGATTKAGKPCKNWATHGSDPPRCAPHGGGVSTIGAPKGNTNALKHGFYSQAVTIESAIDGLVDKMHRMDSIITAGQLENADLFRVFELYTQASSRLGRLLRDKRALSGDAADGIAGAIAQALDELSTELGVEL